jgi:hypothetical protein
LQVVLRVDGREVRRTSFRPGKRRSRPQGLPGNMNEIDHVLE